MFGAGALVPLAGQLVPVAKAIVSVARGVGEFCVLAGVEAGCPGRRLGVLVAARGLAWGPAPSSAWGSVWGAMSCLWALVQRELWGTC